MPTPKPIETLDDLWVVCSGHDWYYAMSDDFRWYSAGQANFDRIRRAAKALGMEGEALLDNWSDHIYRKAARPDRPEEE